ncbi:hypothetical protein GF325_01825 [Candidatus Bathyarchaeota archaeon]|nr:hypothetical protein [Candidatus Bathyarchaeota archaeon]
MNPEPSINQKSEVIAKMFQYYECSVCGSTKKPKKTKIVKNMEYQYQCPSCKHIGPFEEFLPQDTMRYLFC